MVMLGSGSIKVEPYKTEIFASIVRRHLCLCWAGLDPGWMPYAFR